MVILEVYSNHPNSGFEVKLNHHNYVTGSVEGAKFPVEVVEAYINKMNGDDK